MTKSELKKLINEVLSETQFLKEGLPTGKSKNAKSSAITLNAICNLILRPDLQNKALKAASDIINLIDDDEDNTVINEVQAVNLDLNKIQDVRIAYSGPVGSKDPIDAYAVSAKYQGRALTAVELEWLNDNHFGIVQDIARNLPTSSPRSPRS